MSSHPYTDDLERQGDLQPGMSRHDREWNAANGVREPAADLSRMAEEIRGKLIDRVGAIGPGDRVSARYMLEAVQVIKALHDEMQRWRRDYSEAEKDHVDAIAAYCEAKTKIERLCARLKELEEGNER